jgi:hypothetical protein
MQNTHSRVISLGSGNDCRWSLSCCFPPTQTCAAFFCIANNSINRVDWHFWLWPSCVCICAIARVAAVTLLACAGAGENGVHFIGPGDARLAAGCQVLPAPRADWRGVWSFYLNTHIGSSHWRLGILRFAIATPSCLFITTRCPLPIQLYTFSLRILGQDQSQLLVF